MKDYTGLNDYTLFSVVDKYMTAECTDAECSVEMHQYCPKEQFKFISINRKPLSPGPNKAMVQTKTRKRLFNFRWQCFPKFWPVD